MQGQIDRRNLDEYRLFTQDMILGDLRLDITGFTTTLQMNIDPTTLEYSYILCMAMAGLMGEATHNMYDTQLRFISGMACGKQRDYGTQNILTFGHLGIIVRISDKVARLKNLLDNTMAAAVNESIEDSWSDIVGYCLVGLMLLDGTFELPLADD